MAGKPQELSEFIVAADAVGERLDVFLAARAGGVSRAKIQKLIEQGTVLLNGAPAKAREQVAEGDLVTVAWPPAPPSKLAAVAMKLDVLFEDDDIIVINKPAGLSVHPGAGSHGPTLVQGLLHHCGALGASARSGHVDKTAWVRPGIVHRLDKDTSGVMVAAKTDKAHAALAKQFHDKETLQREYMALLDGVLPKAEIMHESYLHRDPANRLRFASLTPASYEQMQRKVGAKELKAYRYAKSFFVSDQTFAHRLTLAKVRLYTGRTHQIRVHAKDLNAPVIGDQLYGRPAQLPRGFPEGLRAKIAGLGRQMLHARSLVFRHPTKGDACRFEAPPPEDFSNILRDLAVFKDPADLPIKR